MEALYGLGEIMSFTKLGSGNNRDFKKIGKGSVVEESARIYGAKYIEIGENCYIGPGAYLRGKIVIGDNVWIGPNADLNGEGGLEIGNGVGIGNGVHILTMQHDTTGEGPISLRDLISNKVVLNDGCNIGIGSCIRPGVTIGECVQVGMGSVVTRSLKPHLTFAGNPARCIDAMR